MSLAQPHFQKFFPPLRRGKRSLDSLSGCREGMGKWEPGFPELSRARLEHWGLSPGPKGRFSPETEAGPQPEVSEELTSGTAPRHVRADQAVSVAAEQRQEARRTESHWASHRPF